MKRDHARLIDELSAAGDSAGYRNEVFDMVRFIEGNSPALDEFLTAAGSTAVVSVSQTLHNR